eukprot:GFYU01042844.1.p1 GENE.GFYU01042844.1~~GFYU01042844.1.p1  ORF type:complete len:236 (-),score=36.46 GFYU01042844.1:28-675(-)
MTKAVADQTPKSAEEFLRPAPFSDRPKSAKKQPKKLKGGKAGKDYVEVKAGEPIQADDYYSNIGQEMLTEGQQDKQDYETDRKKIHSMQQFAKEFWVEHGSVMAIFWITWFQLRYLLGKMELVPKPDVLEMLLEAPTEEDRKNLTTLLSLYFSVAYFGYLLQPKPRRALFSSKYFKWLKDFGVPYYYLPWGQKVYVSVFAAAVCIYCSTIHPDQL